MAPSGGLPQVHKIALRFVKIVLSSFVVLSTRNMNALYKYFWFKRLPCRWHDCINLFSVGSNGRNILIFVYTQKIAMLHLHIMKLWDCFMCLTELQEILVRQFAFSANVTVVL